MRSDDHDRDDDGGRDLVTTCVGRAAKSKGSEVDRGDILNQPLDAQNSKSSTDLCTHKTKNLKPTSASSSPSCRRVRRRRRLADVFAGLLDDFPPTSSRAASGDCPGPPPGLPPRPPSKMDHFSIVRCIRIGHFSARSAPVPFWDLGRPGSPRAKHTAKPQRRVQY